MYNKKWTAGLYLLPALVLVTVFIYVAIGLNFYYSLFRWSTYTEKVWVGLSNYVRMFQDQNFWTALTNNLFFAVTSVVCQVGFALVLAAVLEQKWLRKAGGFCRTIFFIPSLISISVVSLMWQLMLNPSMGFVNRFLKAVGLGTLAIDWLGKPSTAIWCVIYIMTAGGPGRSSEVMGTLLYRTGFREDAMGYASAIGAAIFVITFALSIAQIRMFNMGNEEKEGV